jgi:hypothetical protein
VNFWTQVWIKVALKNAKTVKEQAKSIERMRELHIPCSDESADLFDYRYCLGCSTPDQETPMPYPCPTIKALDGEQG